MGFPWCEEDEKLNFFSSDTHQYIMEKNSEKGGQVFGKTLMPTLLQRCPKPLTILSISLLEDTWVGIPKVIQPHAGPL
jgi:hypothetical protein